jgi:Putative regulator of cell autolysis
MKASFVCELTTSNTKYKTDNTLIIPIKGVNDKILGILEVSNIVDSHFGFDEEYFAIALTQLLTSLMQRISRERAIENLNRIKNLLLDAEIDLCNCKSLYSFMLTAKKWASSIFGVSTSNLLFVEGDQFVCYTGENE